MLTLIGVSINDCPINEKVIIVVILNVAIFVFMVVLILRPLNDLYSVRFQL